MGKLSTILLDFIISSLEAALIDTGICQAYQGRIFLPITWPKTNGTKRKRAASLTPGSSLKQQLSKNS